jgi:hypothetical protein
MGGNLGSASLIDLESFRLARRKLIKEFDILPHHTHRLVGDFQSLFVPTCLFPLFLH